MLWIGALLLVACVLLRLAKRAVQRMTLAWALLSIAYTVSFHAGVVLVVFGLWWG